MAPGVVGTSNPSVFGSTSGENAYFIDDLDMSASYALQLGSIRTELIGTVYNVFGQEQGTGVCGNNTGCTGYLPDGVTLVEYDFGDTTSWQTPRRFEVGFRIEF